MNGRIAHVLLPKDYVRLRPCGEHATHVTDASGTLLFDVAARRWSARVVEALEVDPAWLPRALESPVVSGPADGGVAVAAGAGDQGAGAAWMRPGEVVEPVAGWIEPYREARERFRALYPALYARR